MLTISRLNLWGKEIGDHPPTVTYEGVMASDVGVKEWTALIVSVSPFND